MARYSHKRHDTIRYDITQNIAIQYDPIRKCFTVCKNRMLSVTNYSYTRPQVQQQAGNSAQHWSTVVLPINTVATAGAWILANWLGDGRRLAGFLKSRVIQQGYFEYWPPNNSSCGNSEQLLLFGGRTARLFGGRTGGGRSHGSNIK